MAVACALVALTTSCSPGSQDEPASTGGSTAFAGLIANAIREANEGSASREQVELLELASAEGEMTYARAHQGLTNYFTCLADNGIEAWEEPVAPARSFPPMRYSVGADDPTVMDLCYVAEFMYVDTVYQLQPSIAAEVERVVMESAPLIIACLEGAGFPITTDPTYDELRDAAYFAWYGVHVGTSLADAPEDWSGADCYAAAGIETSALHDGPG